MKAYVFPGQGSQFLGMAQDLYHNYPLARERFAQAKNILGYELTEIIWKGSEELLRQTEFTQPAIFVHSVILAEILKEQKTFEPKAVAGHSLGEFSALVAAEYLSFEEGLRLVNTRAHAMSKANKNKLVAMAAILGLEDALVENTCQIVMQNNPTEIVVPANYNTKGQIVISGSQLGVNLALEEQGLRKFVLLPVSGAFHSPLMISAQEELAAAIEKCSFKQGICPIYQNVDAKATQDLAHIQKNLLIQLTAPVRWTQTMENMLAAHINHVVEVGPGSVLQGLFKKINKNLTLSSALA